MKRSAAAISILLILAIGVQWWSIAHAVTPALDAVRYVGIAQRFERDGLRATLQNEPEHPLFPALVWLTHAAIAKSGVAEWMGHSTFAWATAAQCAAAGMLLLTIIPVWLLLRQLVDVPSAFAGALFFCTMSELACLGADGLSDSTQLFFMAIAFCALARCWHKPQEAPRPGTPGRGDGVRGLRALGKPSPQPSPGIPGEGAGKPAILLLIAGLSTGAALLARPEALLLAPAVAGTMLWMQVHARWRQAWPRLALSYGGFALGLALVIGPYLWISDSLTPRTAWGRVLGRDLIESSPPQTATAPPTAHNIWRLKDGQRMEFPLKESSSSSRFRGYVAAIREYAKELPEVFQYWIGGLALFGLWFQLLPLPVLRERAGVRAVPAYRRPLSPILSPEYRGEGACKIASDNAVRPFGRFCLVYFTVHSLAAIHHAAGVGYLSPRHLAPLVLLGLAPAGFGAWELGRRIADALVGTASRAGQASREISILAQGMCRSARGNYCACAIVALAVVISLPRTLSPLHQSRYPHRQAGEWLAADATKDGAVLDTRGITGLYSGRTTHRYDAAKAAFRSSDLAYIVLEQRELEFDSSRSRTLQHLLASAGERIAVFEAPSHRPQDQVVIYRWHPERWTPNLNTPQLTN